MPSPWFHYHTAFELLAGANLALFALPNLRRPAIDGEEKRWASLLSIVPQGDLLYGRVLAGVSGFRRAVVSVEGQADSVRAFCLVMAAVCAGTLLVATANADETPDPATPWIVIAASLAPSIVLFGLDAKARCKLRESSVLRRSLENEALQG